MDHQLIQTVFNVEPLKNIVGFGDIMAYQIVVSDGSPLGTVGTVSVPAHAEICNDPVFSGRAGRVAMARRRLPRLRRMIANLIA